MAEPVTLQTLLTYLTLISVPIGVFYHIMTLNNTRKNQQMQLETRQAQLFMQIYQDMSSPEFYRISNELLKMEWEDWDDYHRKYGAENNPENFALRSSMWNRLNGVGLLVKAGLIDVDRVYDLMRSNILWHWEKWGDHIIIVRELYNDLDWMEGFEFLANEMVKEVERRGFSADVPKSFYGYIPREKEDT